MPERSIIRQIHSLAGEDRPAERTIRLVRAALPALLEGLKAPALDRVYIIGSGTSFNAAQVGKYIFEELAGVPAEGMQAYDFAAYQSPALLNERTLLVGFTTSGHTTAVAVSFAKARARGAATVAVTAVSDSDTARAADGVLPTGAEDEAQMRRTKAQSLGLVSMVLLAIALGRRQGHLSAEQAAAYEADMERTVQVFPQIMGEVEAKMKALAEGYARADNLFVLGCGPNVGTAECGALMITEMAGNHALGEQMENFLHGRFREVEAKTPFILVAPQGAGSERTLDFLTVTDHIQVPTIVLTDEVSPALETLATHVVRMPGGIPELFTPIVYVTALHLFGYYMAVARGVDPLGSGTPGISPSDVTYRQMHGR